MPAESNTSAPQGDPLAGLSVPPLALPSVPDVSPTSVYVTTFLVCFVVGRVLRSTIRRVRAA